MDRKGDKVYSVLNNHANVALLIIRKWRSIPSTTLSQVAMQDLKWLSIVLGKVKQETQDRELMTEDKGLRTRTNGKQCMGLHYWHCDTSYQICDRS